MCDTPESRALDLFGDPVESLHAYRSRIRKMPSDKFEEEVVRAIFLYLRFNEEITRRRRNAAYDEAVRREGLNSPIYSRAYSLALKVVAMTESGKKEEEWAQEASP